MCRGASLFSAVLSNFMPTLTPGTLSYYIDLVLINIVNVNDIGVAPDSNSITASPGLHLVYASYSGDDVNCSFTSTPILFTVNATANNCLGEPESYMCRAIDNVFGDRLTSRCNWKHHIFNWSHRTMYGNFTCDELHRFSKYDWFPNRYRDL